MKKKIAILTGGGDCPGLNGVIRAVTKKAILEHEMEVFGIEDGYEGLIRKKSRKLELRHVAGILSLGGTVLGTSNRANPYKYNVSKNGKPQFEDVSGEAINFIKHMGWDCLVCIGGEGTLGIAYKLSQQGVSIVGVPKTIDNDIPETDVSFGFNTAVQIATEGIDRLHTTAQAHHRVMITEVMGRHAGWIALYAGIAGGGDVILIPEIPFDLQTISLRVKERSKRGTRCSIIVAAEGAKQKGGEAIVKRVVEGSPSPIRLGGIGFFLEKEIQDRTGLDCRAVVMGHLQRGGVPSAFDRLLATQLGTKVVESIHQEEFGTMVGIQKGELMNISLEKIAKGPRLIHSDHPLITSARSIGTWFGDL